MNKINTKSCKEYLIEHFKNKGVLTNASDWKRIKKYKKHVS